MTEPESTSTRLSILGLKKFVVDKLNPKSALRSVLLAERDEIPISDLLSRIPVWLTLLRHEESRS
jgi:hypothetical protein